jgi:glycerol-3-phosphate acyltransferase PlsY
MIAQLVVSVIVGYLLGSIPFGVLLTRAAGMGDIREVGSGNIGATNVLRTGNRWLAAATLALDCGKGALAVWLASVYGHDTALLAGAAAVVGHLFPVWLRFKGGKGVATGLGVMLAVAPWVGLLGLAIWVASAYFTRYSSLAALLSYGLAPIYAWVLAGPRPALLVLFIAILVFSRHGENIRRLRAGTENKIGKKS